MRALHVALCVLLFALCSCSATTATPVPTPHPPPELMSLPRTATTKCTGNPRGLVTLWEYPGITPDDPNSAYMGKRGKALGTVPFCSEVQVLEFAWSETDRVFWVRVVAGGASGWVYLDDLDFTVQKN